VAQRSKSLAHNRKTAALALVRGLRGALRLPFTHAPRVMDVGDAAIGMLLLAPEGVPCCASCPLTGHFERSFQSTAIQSRSCMRLPLAEVESAGLPGGHCRQMSPNVVCTTTSDRRFCLEASDLSLEAINSGLLYRLSYSPAPRFLPDREWYRGMGSNHRFLEVVISPLLDS
jgi:hypothetical protein